jgi:hypothetical protein
MLADRSCWVCLIPQCRQLERARHASRAYRWTTGGSGRRASACLPASVIMTDGQPCLRDSATAWKCPLPIFCWHTFDGLSVAAVCFSSLSLLTGVPRAVVHSFTRMHALVLLAALAGSASAVSPVTSISRKSFQVEPRLLSNSSINSQIRLAYHGATGMTVSWNTFSQLSNPTVRYGLDPSLSQTASSSVSVTYQTSLTYNNRELGTECQSGDLGLT